MSEVTSVTAGGFTLSGFAGNATYDTSSSSFVQAYLDLLPGSAASYWFSAPSTSDAFIFDTSGTGAFSGPQVIAANGSATDSWSLTISFLTSTHNNVPGGTSDYLYAGNSVGFAAFKVGDAGSGYAASATAYGTSSILLEGAFQSLRLHINSPSVQISLTFTLTDLNVGARTAWTEFFTACFAAGTHIGTPCGETAVEALRIGDRVLTRAGVARKVKWIGRRAYSAAEVAGHRQLRPVVIHRGALGGGLPRRDLTVSALHGMFVDGVLVPAVALVNGVTIRRSDVPAHITYLHVEFDTHDIIFAEGAPAESFMDDNSRLLFDNADEFYALRGAAPPAPARLPRLEEGRELEAISRRLAPRRRHAGIGTLLGHVESLTGGVLRGWAVDAGGVGPVELEVTVSDVAVARVIANGYRVDLDHAGIGGGIGGFTVALPAAAHPDRIRVCRAYDGAILPRRNMPAESPAFAQH